MTASPTQRIAYIGLGNMGGGMASRLADSGYEISVYNRTREKAEEPAELGARVAESPADAAAGADVVMMSLASEGVVEQMMFGDDGVAGALRDGGYLVDMSTVSPTFAREMAERGRSAGFKPLDACVYGAPFHARSGELRVMVGADEEDFRAVEPILQVLGKQVVFLGPNGLGATMKLVINMLMGVQMPALAEAVVFGEKAGLPRNAILDMIAGSGYSSPVMNFRCPMMKERHFDDPAFRLSLMRKDMMLLLAESQKFDVPMPVSEASYASLTAAMAQGLGDLDVAAIVAFQERFSGMTDYPWPLDET